VIFGHEPGGGVQAECGDGSRLEESFFFYGAVTGAEQGSWVLPRSQTATENCTLHNLNVVPTRKGDVLVHGRYQSGIGVLDFSDRADAQEIAYADPAPLSPTQLILGGDWSSYWYNGRIYESDITRGPMIWNLSSSAVAGAEKLDHLNPQTQEFTFGYRAVRSVGGVRKVASGAWLRPNQPEWCSSSISWPPSVAPRCSRIAVISLS
jgi:hypothetical protein